MKAIFLIMISTSFIFGETGLQRGCRELAKEEFSSRALYVSGYIVSYFHQYCKKYTSEDVIDICKDTIGGQIDIEDYIAGMRKKLNDDKWTNCK